MANPPSSTEYKVCRICDQNQTGKPTAKVKIGKFTHVFCKRCWGVLKEKMK